MINKKRCYIHTNHPITCFIVPIVGDAELNLTHDEIYKCLCAKAEVAEILHDGRRINLDFSNYNKNNDWTLVADNEPIGGPYVGGTPEPVEDMTFKGETPEPIPAIINIESEVETIEEVVTEPEEIAEELEEVVEETEDEVITEEETIEVVEESEVETIEEVHDEVITEEETIEEVVTEPEEKVIVEPKVVSAKQVTASNHNKNNYKKKNKR